MKDSWTRIAEGEGVIFGEHQPSHGESWFVVADEMFERFKIDLSPTKEGTVLVGFAAFWHDSIPGLADFTHGMHNECARSDDVYISDTGLLTVLPKHPTPCTTTLDFRKGFTLQLPKEFVPIMRQAIAHAFDEADRRHNHQGDLNACI